MNAHERRLERRKVVRAKEEFSRAKAALDRLNDEQLTATLNLAKSLDTTFATHAPMSGGFYYVSTRQR